jgi:maltooligosyltrehalose trehalohydrolase
MPTMALQRRLPIGADVSGGGVHFRVWAPRRNDVDVVVEGQEIKLEREPGGYFSGFSEWARPGMRYGFRLDRGDRLFPDPASRYQPEGPHALSQIVDPSTYRWRDTAWRGVRIQGQIAYEMHIGTFTRSGTWKSASEVLPELADIGITLLEVMPVAEFPGTFGWGYDGVDIFAPSHLYGAPDDFRAFVERAHALGLAVILDVVYNHFGPDGNYLKEFSQDYFTDRHINEWGEPINFDGENAGQVREFFVTNACYWIEEFHLDGLRLDATQQIFDDSADHILTAITSKVRQAAGSRSIVIIAENEPQQAQLVRSREQNGYGLDAIWNDDFHHTAHVALTGHCEAYYSDYKGSPQEFISTAKWGFLYQGQYYTWQKKTRGSYALDLEPAAFVNYIQNHDQIANSAYGARVQELTTPGRYRAITALMLLLPGTPLLFQGQEYGESSPFLYFADHNRELNLAVQRGRAEFLHQFPGIRNDGTEFAGGLPGDSNTFEKCKLDHNKRRTNAHIVALHRDLIRLRRTDPVFRAQRSDWIHGAVIGAEAFALRFLNDSAGDRLIIVNLGSTLTLSPNPEPLLAPPRTGQWKVLWCSENPRYGGAGSPCIQTSQLWSIPAHCAVVMHGGDL